MGIFSFLSGSQPQPAVVPQYTGLQIQTSSNALPTPIVYGTNVIAPNIIFAGRFIASPIEDSKGHITGYNYFQDLIFGLCEGGSNGIARVGLTFQDSDIYTLGDQGAILVNGALPPGLPTGPNFVSAQKQLAYAGTAYAYAHFYNLGISASTGSLNFEVHGIFDATSGQNAYDADPALVLQDFLTSPTYGVGVPPAALDLSTILSPATGADASYQGYCKAAGLGFSPSLVNTEKANSTLTRWLQLTNSAAVWSGGKLKIIPYGDTAVTTDPRTGTLSQPIPAIDGDTTDGPSAPYIRVNFGFLTDGGVVNDSTGVPFKAVSSAASLQKGQYYLSTRLPGRYVFSTDDVNVQVTITFTYAPVGGFTPNLTPVYDLTDDDFMEDSGTDPVVVSRTDPSQIANVMRLEIADRNNFYSSTTIEARDQNAVEQYGYRLGSTVTAHEITNAQSAQVVAQLILQRGLGVRNTYAFKLSWEFALLEPMDIVTLTDANLGLAKTPVRVTSIEEDDQGLLSIAAEELVVGVGTAMAYATGGAVGGNPGATTALPSLINTPVILELPSELADNAVDLVFGVSAGATAPADPSYGGCNVFVSFDSGTTWSQIASFMGQSDQGVLAAPLPAASGEDTTDTLTVDVSQSGATLDASSQAQARALQTLILVDDELIAYGSAVGTPGASYALTFFERGLYGSRGAAHATGARFLELAGLVGTATLPNAAMGTTALFKVQGFNIFGKSAQPLSSCVTYSKFIYGSGLFGMVATALSAGSSVDCGRASGTIAETEDFGFASDPYPRVVDLGLASS